MQTEELELCLDCDLVIKEDDQKFNTFHGSYHEECYWNTRFECARCGDVYEDCQLRTYRLEECCQYCILICGNCDSYYDEQEGCEYCSENDDHYDVDSIMDYGARAENFLSFKGDPKDKMYFGIELEVEVNSGHKRSDVARNVRQTMPDFVITKQDGSLDNGFEIVTAPASLEEHYKAWESFFSVKWPMRSFNTTTCGMHVHISREALTPSTLGRMYVFLHEPENIRFIEQISGRSLRSGNGGNYAPLRPGGTMKLTERVGVTKPSRFKGKHIYYKPLYMRGAINDSNDQTIEIRIFKGTLAKEGFFKNLQFVRALTQFCKPGVVSLGEVGSNAKFKEFVAKNRKEYKYLDAFIKERDSRPPKTTDSETH